MFVGQVEWYVYLGVGVWLDWVGVEVVGIDGFVQQVFFGVVVLFYCGYFVLFFQLFEDQVGQVLGVSCWGVVYGIVVCGDFVVEYGWIDVVGVVEQVFVNDYYYQVGWVDVFLCFGIDQVEVGYVEWV